MPARNSNKSLPIDFSFIFFSDSSQKLENKYQLVFDIADFADKHQFTAVWMPERHFHPFGGIYPNPSVLAAAIAVKTQHIRLRSGSVVLPLHHPVSVAESWAMVDNLSHGRVDLGFASGWNPNDFITCPDKYSERRKIWQTDISTVQQLWRGESLKFINGNQLETSINIYPKPIQSTLNVWFVVTKLEESFRYAGENGYNLLTMLQGGDLSELSHKIKIYRDARALHGHEPNTGIVTLMLHTLLLDDLATVAQSVKEPFSRYIRSALTGHLQSLPVHERPSETEVNKIVEYSYERYFQTGALFGSVDDAVKIVDKAIDAGVNEIACLLDFIDDSNLILDSLHYINELKNRYSVDGNEKVGTYE